MCLLVGKHPDWLLAHSPCIQPPTHRWTHRVAGQQRLIVSVQVDDDGTPPCRGHVLIMELPPPRSQQPGTMSCEALQRTAQGSTQGGGAAAPMPVAVRAVVGACL